MINEANEFFNGYSKELSGHLSSLDKNRLSAFAAELERVRREGKTVYIMGNGGSASTASHMANDFSKTASVEGVSRIRALSLADNISLMTAIGNDISYDDIFSYQLETLLQKGDLVVLISGSGNSMNVVRAADTAKAKGVKIVGLLGFDGGKLKNKVDLLLHIESRNYGVIEDAHLSIGHMLTFYFKTKNGGRK